MEPYIPQTNFGRFFFPIRRVILCLCLVWALSMPVFYLSGTEFCAPLSTLFRFPLFLYLAQAVPALIVCTAICLLVCVAMVLSSTRRFCRKISVWLVLTVAFAVDIWGQIMCYQAFYSPDKELLSYRGYLYFSDVRPMDGSLYLVSLFCDLLLFILCTYPLIAGRKAKEVPEEEEEAREEITTDNWLEILTEEDPEDEDGPPMP